LAHIAIRWNDELDDGLVLAPERYDPRISQKDHLGDARSGLTLSQLVDASREVLSPSKAEPMQLYMVLDTGDASNGIISRKSLVGPDGIGSTKKILRPGDVIISRLRPYLRQIGFVDAELANEGVVVASSEFYVLRPRGAVSIAYLIPFLLSDRIQQILCASQEGGHHPRVPEKTLMNLVVPNSFLQSSSELCSKVRKATETARKSETIVLELLAEATRLMSLQEG
jgi:hypothetical protein